MITQPLDIYYNYVNHRICIYVLLKCMIAYGSCVDQSDEMGFCRALCLAVYILYTL